MFVRVSVCSSVCLFVRLFTFEVPFKCIFAAISWRLVSKTFRDSESFWEKKWKEVVSHLKTFTNRGCKITAQKKVFFPANWGLINHQSLRHFSIFSIFKKVFLFIALLIRRLYNKDQQVISRIFLVSVLLSASVERCFVFCMRDF